jgi:hypothetical protein
MLYFYFMLVLGAFFVIAAVLLLIVLYVDRDYSLFNVAKIIGMLAVGGLFLAVTLPSLKYVVLKEYDVVAGKCVIDIVSSGRSSDVQFNMIDTDEWFTFRDIPELGAYGKSIPYYCEVTVTKDHMFEIGYKIFDAETRELLLTSK